MPYSYRKRTFLNPISTGKASYIQAGVESSDGGEYYVGRNYLSIADCTRVVEFEFYLGTPRHIRESLAKAELLKKVITDFAEALKRQAELIERLQKSKK